MTKKHRKHAHGPSRKKGEAAASQENPESTGLAPSLALGLGAGRVPVRPAAAPGIVVVEPGRPFTLADVATDADGGFEKAEAKEALRAERERIRTVQQRLYAERKQALLVVLQATDTGGKDGTIRHVFSGVNPQGCRVASFKVPSAQEAEHDFLWRYHARVPGRGMIGVFNRSHYEDVLVVRAKGLAEEAVWRPRYALINDFERLLTESDVTILKFFLHISKAEQKRRLQARIEDPRKHWKLDPADFAERARWDAYQAAFDEALARCSTPYAPWLVVPADRKWYRNLVVARTIANTLEAMDPRFPEAAEGISDLKVPD